MNNRVIDPWDKPIKEEEDSSKLFEEDATHEKESLYKVDQFLGQQANEPPTAPCNFFSSI
jgi:hypothetical protein